MNATDYPSLFVSAEAASQRAKRMHLGLQGAHLVLLGVASVLGGLAASGARGAAADGAGALEAITVAVLASGILVYWIARGRDDERVWFDSRVVAESVRTATWRFMMRAVPFEGDAAVDRFPLEIAEVRRSHGEVARGAAAFLGADATVISEVMVDARARSVEARREIFLRERLAHQQEWYARRARAAGRAESRWSLLSTVMQGAAVVVAILAMGPWDPTSNLVAVLMTAAAAIAAWTQTQRHAMLARSYTVAAHELAELRPALEHAGDEAALREVVDTVELAISREHTTWRSWRDVRSAPPGGATRV